MIEGIDQPSKIYDAAKAILNDCVIGNPHRVGGQIMFLGEYFASHWIMSYALVDSHGFVGRSLPSLASSSITGFIYDDLGNSRRLSVRIIQRTASGVHCGTSQLLSPSCQTVVDAMPVMRNKIQKYGPPGDATVTVSLPWSLEKSDSCKPRNLFLRLETYS